MNRSIPMLVIGLVFGGLVGFLLAAGYGVTLDGHDHGSDHGGDSHQASGSHDHAETIDVSGDKTPVVDAILHADPMGGWNLEVQTQNFRFAPEHVSTPHVIGEGHAHVYVNGTKIGRLYGNWMQMPSLVAGDVVAVILSSNDHKTLAVGAKAVTATVTTP